MRQATCRAKICICWIPNTAQVWCNLQQHRVLASSYNRSAWHWKKSCHQACCPCRGLFYSQRACPVLYSARFPNTPTFNFPQETSTMPFTSTAEWPLIHRKYMFMYTYWHPFIYNIISHYNIFQRIFLNLCQFMISCKSPRIFWSKLNTPQVWEEHSVSL